MNKSQELISILESNMIKFIQSASVSNHKAQDAFTNTIEYLASNGYEDGVDYQEGDDPYEFNILIDKNKVSKLLPILTKHGYHKE